MSNVPTATTMCGGGGGGETAAREVDPVGEAPALQPASSSAARLSDAETFSTRPGGTDTTGVALVAEMTGTAEEPLWSIHHLAAGEKAALEADGFAGVVVQMPDGVSGWQERARLTTPGDGWCFGVRALTRPARLVFVGAFELQQTWNAVKCGADAGTAELEEARHSRSGDLTTEVGTAGGYDHGLVEGDTLKLRYGRSSVAADSYQPWFMAVGMAGTATVQGFRRQDKPRQEPMPTAFALRQNRPNPFSGTTEIRFELPVAAPVRLEVFDAQGRLVRTLAAGTYPVGFHAVVWDQRDASGTRVRPGIYLYRIAAGIFSEQRKMVLL